MSREIDIECIWIPSHRGLPKNDAADELARRGILESDLLILQAVPLAMESARSIIKRTVQTNVIRQSRQSASDTNSSWRETAGSFGS